MLKAELCNMERSQMQEGMDTTRADPGLGPQGHGLGRRPKVQRRWTELALAPVLSDYWLRHWAQHI
jgi:hypothetical protein